MLEKIRHTIEETTAFKALIAAESRTVSVTGIAGSLGAFVVAGLRDHLQRQIIMTAHDETSAEHLCDDLGLLLGQETVRLFTGIRSASHSITQDVAAMQALRSLRDSPRSIVVASPRGLASQLPLPSMFDARVIRLVKGEQRDYQALIAQLGEFGFEQKEFVEAHGDFAIRGGILDVYTFSGENPVRIEFAADEVESIREFDPVSQRSIHELTEAAIHPDLLTHTNDGVGTGRMASLLDYVNNDALVVMDEPDVIRRAVEDLRNRTDGADLFAYDQLEEILALFSRLNFIRLTQNDPAVIDFGAHPQPAFNGSVALLRRDLAGLQADRFSLFLTCDSQSELHRLKDLLSELHDPSHSDEDHPEAAIDLDAIEFSLDAHHGGFLVPSAGLALYTEHQIFNRLKRRGKKRTTRFKGLTDRELQKLAKGDYVVHQDFGIGRFDGLKRIRIGGAEQEVVKILYEANDTLFVNLNYVNKLQKYSSQEGHRPALTRLGSADWERLTSRAKKKLKDIARDLITLYARRKNSVGFPFSLDTPWQKELEASFMYEDTFDQAKATLEVKKDMELPHPMDRLICGDVGFGKTEVAVRAAFKATLDARQTAVLVPTTILAIQHYNTFRDRLARYGVRLEVMSRFRSTKEQADIVAGLREGNVDIVIGTHRILSRDIMFKNLGLLIIDEEHRFGVAAKEKLRHLRTDVDTLSLTATPIPRTLHFSLMGARDLSIMATPPRNRLPVITEIIQWDDEVIRDGVKRELQRGGQVYFVHDRVQTMDDVIERLQRILLSVRIRAAHGQMSTRMLEAVMLEFLEKQCDVLVATKIIESGLDIPNVNTIFINRADRFGMAELYQLRGRVGRSNVQAYAYLLTPPVSTMPRPTLQRLQAVEEFTELGSGLNLAMRDLEIRGAGNLLGAEQSGFIENMGFETYTRILEEAVQELKDEEFQDIFKGKHATGRVEREAAVEADLDAFIPESYVRSDADRLGLYRRLYALTTQEQLNEVREEMNDRFGKFPLEIENLFGMVTLRLAAAEMGLSKITLHGDQMDADFPPESDSAFYSSELFQSIMAVIARLKSQGAVLRQSGKTLRLSVRLETEGPPHQKLSKALSILRILTESHHGPEHPAGG